MSLTNQTLEGTWEEIARHGERLAGQRVRLIILGGDPAGGDQTGPSPAEGSPIYFGMFPGSIETSDEEFRSAEFHGDPEDGLDWP